MTKLRDDFKDAKNAADRAGGDVERLVRECRAVRDGLPDEHRDRVGDHDDPAAGTYPTADDIDAVRRQAGDAPTHRLKLNEAQEVVKRYEVLRGQKETAGKTLDTLRAALPAGDAGAIRSRYQSAKADEATLSAAIAAAKANIKKIDADLEKLQARLATAVNESAELDKQANAEEVGRTRDLEGVEQETKALPAAWRDPAAKAGLADVNRWKAELEALAKNGTEARYEAMTKARVGLETLDAEIAAAEGQANAFAPEARVGVEQVRGAMSRARVELKARRGTLAGGQGGQGHPRPPPPRPRPLADRHPGRREGTQLPRDAVAIARPGPPATVPRPHRRSGRSSITPTPCSIGCPAGSCSCGCAAARKGRGPTRRCNWRRATGRRPARPINVAFLSGSQRFRVAVSLALGIGQYASRQHRPIESVIIDEGFGCLDRQGRQVMIQELQNLRGQLPVHSARVAPGGVRGGVPGRVQVRAAERRDQDHAAPALTRQRSAATREGAGRGILAQGSAAAMPMTPASASAPVSDRSGGYSRYGTGSPGQHRPAFVSKRRCGAVPKWYGHNNTSLKNEPVETNGWMIPKSQP